MKRKLWGMWIFLTLTMLAGLVTAVAEPMGMMASSGGETHFWERDLIWGSGVVMWSFIGVGIWKIAPP